MFKLKGKVALITGATGGIGSAIAKSMHSMGATVVVSGTRVDALEGLAHELQDRAHIVPANLKDMSECKNLIAKAEELTGGIDILVCNAGITRDNLMIRLSDEDFDEVINVNLKAPFVLMREAMKHMSKRRHGRIIYISSVVGRSGNFGQTNYAAAKAGGIGMVKSAAFEGAARNITVNAIAPGFIVSPMTDSIRDDIKEHLLAKIPLKKFGTPEDVAAAAVFLASDEARYLTGAVLDVNGGMYT
jgi:3-oxoacyl-[acyl-carrier protein] reductase